MCVKLKSYNVLSHKCDCDLTAITSLLWQYQTVEITSLHVSVKHRLSLIYYYAKIRIFLKYRQLK